MTIERFGLDPEGKFGLSQDDVVSVAGTWFGLRGGFVKLREMTNQLEAWACKNGRGIDPWFTEKGSRCEILRTKGGGWQKGQLRIRLEFIPDNPEAFLNDCRPEDNKLVSPLDDLRSQLDTQ